MPSSEDSVDWSHDELAHDLAECRRAVGEIVAEKLAMGSYGGRAQIDVAVMKPSWTNPNPAAYEVKVSRSDFRQDVQSGKYRKYVPYVRRLYFAAPSGLLQLLEIPDGCGLITRNENGWHVVRAPRVSKIEQEHWCTFLHALLMKSKPGPWAPPTREERIQQLADEEDLRMKAHLLGERVKDALDDAHRARRGIEQVRAHLARALGEDVDGRSVAQLANELVEREKPPPAPVEIPSALRYKITSAHQRLSTAIDLMDRLEQREEEPAHA